MGIQNTDHSKSRQKAAILSRTDVGTIAIAMVLTQLGPFKTNPTKVQILNELGNRPWWPSSLERESNSSRCSLKDPGSNPAWGRLYGKNSD